MPFSSMNFTSEASLKRGGGCVSWPSARASRSSSASPCGERGQAHLRRRRPPASSSGAFCDSVSADLAVHAQEAGVLEHRARGPHAGDLVGRVPCLRWRRPRSRRVVTSLSDGVICEATKRFQIRRYSFSSSGSR